MKSLICALFLGLLLQSCNSQVTNAPEKITKNELKAQISESDDSLKIVYAAFMKDPNQLVPNALLERAKSLNLQYYRTFPKDDFAADCLDKYQQLLSNDKKYVQSVLYADTLVSKYPKYPKRASVLLGLGSTYDMLLNDSTQVRKYYTMLLNEYPKLDAETREQVTFRLAHLELTFDQMIELQVRNIQGK
jgi:hypothetical protein